MDVQLLFQCFARVSSGISADRNEAEQVISNMRADPQFPLVLLAILLDPQPELGHRQICLPLI